MARETSELCRELTELLNRVQQIEARLWFLLDHLVESNGARTGDAGGDTRQA